MSNQTSGQLRGFAQSQGDRGFLPIRSEEMSPSLARRMSWYTQLIDDAVWSKGINDGWIDVRRNASNITTIWVRDVSPTLQNQT